MSDSFVWNGEQVEVSEKEFKIMLRVYLLFKNKRVNIKAFRSLNHIGQVLDNTMNVDVTSKRVFSKMLSFKLLLIKGDGLIHLEEDVFEDFAKTCPFGKVIIWFVDEISTIRV